MNAEVIKQIQPTDKVSVIWTHNGDAIADDVIQTLVDALKSIISSASGNIQIENLENFTANPSSTVGNLILTGWPEAYPPGKHDFNLFSNLVNKMPSGGKLIAREKFDGDLADSVKRIRKAAVLAGLVNIKFVSYCILCVTNLWTHVVAAIPKKIVKIVLFIQRIEFRRLSWALQGQ